MLFTTEGIVLHFIKYKETSIITKIYTSEFGLKSYIVNGIRTSKNNKIAFFQPLTLLNLVVYNRPSLTLNRISEVRCSEPFLDLNKDPFKIMVSFFLAEIINKTVKEEMVNEELFRFIKNTLKTLDEMKEKTSNFPVIFLIKLSSFLGFFPSSGIQLLQFCEVNNFAEIEVDLLQSIVEAEYQNEIKIDGYTRKKILTLLIKFYSMNIEGMDSINSAKVLSDVLSK